MNNQYTYLDLVLARFLRFSFDKDFHPTNDSFMLYNDGNKIFYQSDNFDILIDGKNFDSFLIKEAFNVIFN